MMPANPKPDPTHERQGRFVALGVGIACAICIAAYFLCTTCSQRTRLWENLCRMESSGIVVAGLAVGTVVLLFLMYLAIRSLVSTVIHTMPIVTHGRITVSRRVAHWATPLVLCVASVLALITGFCLLSYFVELNTYERRIFLSFDFRSRQLTLLLTIFIGFVLLSVLSPLVLLMCKHVIDANHRLAARLTFVRAAGLMHAGMDPVGALCNGPVAGNDVSFVQMLDNMVPRLSTRDRALLGAADSLSLLRPVLIQKSEDIQEEDLTSRERFFVGLILLEWSFVFTVALFVMVHVLPKYDWLIRDWGNSAPTSVKILAYFSSWFLGSQPDQALPGGVYVLFSIAIVAQLVRMVVKGKHAAGAWVIRANLPLFKDAVMKPNLVEICFFLSHALRAGIPLPQALSAASTLDINPLVKTRILQWETAVRAGQDPAQSALAAGMPPLVCSFITCAQHGPAVGDALNRLARFYRNQTSRTRLVLQSLLMPAFVLINSVVAGVAIFGLFRAANILIIYR